LSINGLCRGYRFWSVYGPVIRFSPFDLNPRAKEQLAFEFRTEPLFEIARGAKGRVRTVRPNRNPSASRKSGSTYAYGGYPV